MSKALVTGGAGFIGSHLTEKLVGLGHEVTVVDNLSHFELDNLTSVKSKVNLLKINLEDAEALDKAIEGQDYIFHLAANTSVNNSLLKPSWSAGQNTINTVRILEFAAKHKVKRVMFSSSAAIYGYCKELPLKESASITPVSPYALEKLTCENYMKLFAQIYKLDTVSLRYFNVYGPRQNADAPHPGGVTIVVRQLIQDGKSQLMGDGMQTRDMIYVDDVVSANILAMQKKTPCGGAVFNVSTNTTVTVAGMHDKISKIMNMPAAREHIEFPEGNVVHSQGDNTLIKKELGFKPEVSLDEGLKKTIDWCRENMKWTRK
ncbi:MAG: hypothetical protein A2297_08895 [Elusimicrobia bacterium RIFOXYB2_FULL_48_7]|nr:MAG: hypothetical protein A2297_08895 [Elusimicrobia bacterium RIFOXYB2_FULL_48_7]